MSGEKVGFSGDEWKQLVPPGFRFAPTDVELLQYYLFRKVHGQYITPGVIHDADVYQCNPIHLPGVLDKEEEFTYFFTRRERKYQKGSRSARNTKDGKGNWRMTSKHTPVYADENDIKSCVGKKNTLVYNVKTLKGQPDEKTNWIMHEFELDHKLICSSTSSHPAQEKKFNDLIVCRIYKRHPKDEKGKTNEPKYLTNSLNAPKPFMTHNNNGEPPVRLSPKRKFEPDKETLTTCDHPHDISMAMNSNYLYGSHDEVKAAGIWGNMTTTNDTASTTSSTPHDIVVTGAVVPSGSRDQSWATVYQEYECLQNPHVAEKQNSGLVDQMKPDENNPLEAPHNMATRRDDDELNNNMPLGYLPDDLDAISCGDWLDYLFINTRPLPEQELSSYMNYFRI
ncbi:unnamed protein product [Withania somnifera]